MRKAAVLAGKALGIPLIPRSMPPTATRNLAEATPLATWRPIPAARESTFSCLASTSPRSGTYWVMLASGTAYLKERSARLPHRTDATVMNDIQLFLLHTPFYYRKVLPSRAG